MSTIELNIDYMQVDSIVMKRTESIVRSVLKNQWFNTEEQEIMMEKHMLSILYIKMINGDVRVTKE